MQTPRAQQRNTLRGSDAEWAETDCAASPISAQWKQTIMIYHAKCVSAVINQLLTGSSTSVKQMKQCDAYVADTRRCQEVSNEDRTMAMQARTAIVHLSPPIFSTKTLVSVV